MQMPNCEINCELLCSLYIHVNKMNYTGSKHIVSPLKPVATCLLQGIWMISCLKSEDARFWPFISLFFSENWSTVILMFYQTKTRPAIIPCLCFRLIELAGSIPFNLFSENPPSIWLSAGSKCGFLSMT